MPEVASVNRWGANPALSLDLLAECGKRIQVGSMRMEQSDRTTGQSLSGRERERLANVRREFADLLELHEVFCALFDGGETAGTLSVGDLRRDHVVEVTAHRADLPGTNP